MMRYDNGVGATTLGQHVRHDGDGVCGPEQHRPRRAARLTLFDLVKTGNAYRHLDTGDQLEGRAFRKLVGVPEGQRPTDAQFVQQLMLSLLGMAWFNSERMLEWAAQAFDWFAAGCDAESCARQLPD